MLEIQNQIGFTWLFFNMNYCVTFLNNFSVVHVAGDAHSGTWRKKYVWNARWVGFASSLF